MSAKIVNRIMTDKKTLKSMFANMFIKGFGMVVSFFYVPLLLSYLGEEKYGLWATALSVTSWISFCDIGIGGGLRNILTEELTMEQKEKARESVSTAYVILSTLALIMWIVIVTVAKIFGWGNIFGTYIDINFAMTICCSFICLYFVLSLVNVVLYALQMSEQVGIIQISSGVINLIGIIVLAKISTENLNIVATIYGISMIFPVFVNSIRVYTKHKFLRPHLKYYDSRKTKKLLSLGIVFFVLQMGGLMLTATDNILISRLFGSIEVTPVEVVNKLLSVVKSFYVALVIPVWARTTKAITEKDFRWLDKMFRQLLFFLIVFGAGIAALCVFIRPICNIWLGKEVIFSNTMVVIVAIGTFAEMINTSYYSMLNGLGLLKIQLCVAVIQIVVNIPLSIILATKIGLGPNGVKLATTILFLFSGLLYVFYTRYSIHKLKKADSSRRQEGSI